MDDSQLFYFHDPDHRDVFTIRDADPFTLDQLIGVGGMYLISPEIYEHYVLEYGLVERD